MGVTVSERVGELEGRLESYQEQIKGKIEGLEVSLELMRNEFQRVQNIERNMVMMMDQLNLLMEKWEDQEKGRKGKQSEENLLVVSSLIGEATLELRERSKEVGGGFEILGRSEVRSRHLTMLMFKGDDPNG